MKNKLHASYDDLLQNAYGCDPGDLLDNSLKAAALLAGYYGAPLAGQRRYQRRPQPRQTAPALALSLVLNRDDGELLAQAAKNASSRHYAASLSATEVPFEEYVVAGMSLARAAPTGSGSDSAAGNDQSVHEEFVVDILQPLNADIAPAIPLTAPTMQVSKPQPPAPSRFAAAEPIDRPSENSAATSVDTQSSSEKSSTDAFIEDMKSILLGESAFDSNRKTLVPKEQRGHASPSPAEAPRAPEPNRGDEIFAKIAQSMQYANAYDIGTLELENRFADFDRMAELRKTVTEAKKTEKADTTAKAVVHEPALGSTEFIQDLDEIRRQQLVAGSGARARAASPAPIGAPAKAMAQSIGPALSRPFYDTGEHVLVGGNLYADQLRVGPGAGVLFSYGQIIAMGDLFESADEMMGASPVELARIKALIERSTAYYAGNKADPSKDVSDDEWDKATGGDDKSTGRYLRLAELNYEHFSPNFLYPKATFAGAANRHGNNKSAWEHWHERAIQEARAIGAAPASTNSSLLLPLEGPLKTNAFGDHFLTDAFSAGHLVNKDAIIEFWKTMFFKGTDLLPEANEFFEKLAAAAFARGDVRKKFSDLETVEFKGIIFRPNIDRPSRFATLLQEIAKQEPDRIGNLVLKAIHDHLNKVGVDVFNAAGDKPWRLTGDGTLNPENKKIIQKAVEQSVANINDPSIMVSNLDFAPLFAKVWKHVPQLTSASQQAVQRVVRQYVDPGSALLVNAAAEIIEKKAGLLIRELIAANALKPA